MEGLRGFAVFLVFLVHYVTLIGPWIAEKPFLLALGGALHAIGNTGVDLFFVLSGYLIYGSLIERQQEFRRFITRRAVRIYPAFAAVFAVYVALSLAYPAESKIPSPASEGAYYLLQNFLLLPGLFPIVPMISVAWSLSYEMFFYLAIPIVIVVLKLRGRSVIWRVRMFSIVTLIIVLACAAYGGHIRLIMFLSGMLLYEVSTHRLLPAPSSLVGLLALVIGLLATLIPTSGSFGYTAKSSMFFVSFSVLCFACFQDPSAWLPRGFSWTPLRWLGNMSYSYYLIHGLSLKVFFVALAVIMPATDHASWLFWILLPTTFALTLIPAAILFLAIERPFSLSPRRPSVSAAKPRDSAADIVVKPDMPQ